MWFIVSWMFPTEQAGVLVTLQACIQGYSVPISARTPSAVTKDFRVFPQYLQANAAKVPPLSHNCQLLNHLQFIIVPAVKQTTSESKFTRCMISESRCGLISDGSALQQRLKEHQGPWFEPRASSCWRTCAKGLTSADGNQTSASRCLDCPLHTTTPPYVNCSRKPASECTFHGNGQGPSKAY